MAEYTIQSGGVSYRVEAASEDAARGAVAQHQFGNGMVGLFIYALYFIFLLLPKLCVRFAGWIFGLLFKVGFVGKIIQTVIVAVVGAILSVLLVIGTLLPALPLPEFMVGVVNLIVLLAFMGGFAYWYFRYHYDTVKFMSAGTFSKLLTRCFTICFYGGIVLFIFTNRLGNLGAALSFTIPFIIALFYWLFKTKPYSRPRPDIAGWTQAAEAGDPIAQYNLAIAYDDGWGVKEDKAQSLQWYRKAAENGIAEAQYALAQIYSDKYAAAFGIAPDFDKCLDWGQKAAAQGHQGAKEEIDGAKQDLRELLANGSAAEKERAKAMLARLG